MQLSKTLIKRSNTNSLLINNDRLSHLADLNPIVFRHPKEETELFRLPNFAHQLVRN